MSVRTRLLVDAEIRTMVGAGTRGEAIAWRDGRILAVGTRAECEVAAGPAPEVVSAAGATVLPGFIDAHHHQSIVALYGAGLRLVPPAVTEIASLQRTLATAAAKLAPGEWLVATDWNEALLAERRPPTRLELDDAVPDHPLLAMHYTCHRALANSRALALAGIERATPDPSGGVIARGRDGHASGLLIERGQSRVETLGRGSLVARDPEGFLSRLAAHQQALVEVGITCVVDTSVPIDLMGLYREAARRGLLKIPTVMMPVSTTGYFEAPWDALEGPRTGEEDGLLTVGPVKLIFDGAPGCAMCLSWWQAAGATVRSWWMALRQLSLDPVRAMMSVQPRLGAKIRTGIMLYRADEAKEIVRAAAERGFAVATHAIGNEAVDVALQAYEAGGAAIARAGLPRLEHATFLDRAHVARIAAVGAAVVTQPNFLSIPAYASAASIPGLRNAPLRWLLDAGVLVAGSSDFPVAGFDPLDAIRAAVARVTTRGKAYESDQCIELDEALALYTRAAARVIGRLDRCGTLEPGKRADFVVLSGPLASRTDLDAVRVAATIVDGEVVAGSLPS